MKCLKYLRPPLVERRRKSCRAGGARRRRHATRTATSVAAASAAAIITLCSFVPVLALVPRVVVDVDASGLVVGGMDLDDDFVLLQLLALHETGQINLLAITAVGGNAAVELTCADAQALVEAAGSAVPVLCGADVTWSTALALHGPLEPVSEASPPPGDCRGIDVAAGSSCGNGGAGAAAGGRPRCASRPDTAASAWLADALARAAVDEEQDGIVVLALGPLSNVATALCARPLAAQGVRLLVMMGGDLRHPNGHHGAARDAASATGRASDRVGDLPPWTPFHIDLNVVLADPGAANDVLRAPVAKALLPVQTALQVRAARLASAHCTTVKLTERFRCCVP